MFGRLGRRVEDLLGDTRIAVSVSRATAGRALSVALLTSRAI